MIIIWNDFTITVAAIAICVIIAAFCCAEHFFNLTDIILDINSDQPKHFILDWQNESTDYSLINDDKLYINYSSYIKGARFK